MRVNEMNESNEISWLEVASKFTVVPVLCIEDTTL